MMWMYCICIVVTLIACFRFGKEVTDPGEVLGAVFGGLVADGILWFVLANWFSDDVAVWLAFIIYAGWCCVVCLGTRVGVLRNRQYAIQQRAEYEQQQIAQENARREASRCRHCGAEEAIEHLESKCVGTTTQIETVMQMHTHWVPNPNYGLSRPPYFNQYDHDQREYIETVSHVPTQVQVVYKTLEEHYRCKTCNKRWKETHTERYVP
jgi:hypothetical protein